ncbi:class I SAM-dependent methyltransferase [Mycolicibacterium cosmeticum]|uniref:class I SAM-dependent methyltransferase n=1 Tax=Mycolicibacterium cosmeticum TaxID=258533 RepID=UPI0032046D17
MAERNVPDTDEARRRYRGLAGVYDRRIRFIAPIRRRVIERLCLQPGNHVLDMGCGTGASFAALREAVGPTGRVTGVELSEEMAAVARRQVDHQGWDNVEVVVGDATVVPLTTDVDAVLFFLVHDLTRLPRAVERAVAAGRPGARVVAFGAVRATGRPARPVNVIVKTIARRYVTTFEGFDAPWSHLAAQIPGLRVQRALAGGVYIATGQIDR